MVTIAPPTGQSFLSQPMRINNFLAVQSAKLSVSNSSNSIRFTNVPGTIRITAEIANTGTKGCYLASGQDAAVAVVSTITPQPVSGNPSVSNCNYIAPGGTFTKDFVQGTNTFAAICAGTDTTTLEISVGEGQ